MAHIKTGGVAKGNKDSIAKRLGVKVFGGEEVKAGNNEFNKASNQKYLITFQKYIIINIQYPKY